MHELNRPARTTADEVAGLVELAWPIAVAQIGMMLNNVVDTILVGRFDADALAGVALGSSWSQAFILFGVGTAMGLEPAFAQSNGAEDRRGAARSFVRGLVLLTLVAVPITLIHVVTEPGLRFLQQPEVSLPMAGSYAGVLALSVWPVLAFTVVQRALQARGLTRPAMYASVLANVVNLGADYVLLYGIGSWEGVGAVGVAWSTVAVRWVMLFMLLGFARPEVAAFRKHLDAVFETRELWVLAALALPVGAQTALEVWAFSASVIMAGWFGPESVAAHIVALNLSSLSFMIPLSVGGAAASRVGNLVGAGESWGHAAWTAVAVGTGAMVVSAGLYLMIPEFLVSVYMASDEPAWRIAVSLLPIAAAFQLFDGAQAVMFGVLRGAGDTRVPSVIAIVAYWCIGLPVGAYLAVGGGMETRGVWWGLVAGLVVVSLLLVARVRRVQEQGAARV